MLESETTGKLYVGQTNDIEDRLRRHNGGFVLSTKNRGPWKLLFYKLCASRSASVLLERRLKSMNAPRNFGHGYGLGVRTSCGFDPPSFTQNYPQPTLKAICLAFFCYILESETTGKLCVGQTNDIDPVK